MGAVGASGRPGHFTIFFVGVRICVRLRGVSGPVVCTTLRASWVTIVRRQTHVGRQIPPYFRAIFSITDRGRCSENCRKVSPMVSGTPRTRWPSDEDFRVAGRSFVSPCMGDPRLRLPSPPPQPLPTPVHTRTTTQQGPTIHASTLTVVACR